jgi:hypothetical protein
VIEEFVMLGRELEREGWWCRISRAIPFVRTLEDWDRGRAEDLAVWDCSCRPRRTRIPRTNPSYVYLRL